MSSSCHGKIAFNNGAARRTEAKIWESCWLQYSINWTFQCVYTFPKIGQVVGKSATLFFLPLTRVSKLIIVQHVLGHIALTLFAFFVRSMLLECVFAILTATWRGIPPSLVTETFLARIPSPTCVKGPFPHSFLCTRIVLLKLWLRVKQKRSEKVRLICHSSQNSYYFACGLCPPPLPCKGFQGHLSARRTKSLPPSPYLATG